MTSPTPPNDPAAILADLQPDMIDYYRRNGNRMAACRTMMDLLSIDYPTWAYRDPSGRAAQNAAMVYRFKQDNPHARFDR